MGQLLSQSVPQVPEPMLPDTSSRPSSKAKAKAKATILPAPCSSDIENDPLIADDDVSDSTVETVKPKPKASSKAKSSHSLYSYKQYRPEPAVVYIQHEEEANDLVQGLKGPLGFDLEWVVIFRRGKSALSHPTALVQLCDSRMILLIQVSAMKSMPSPFHA